MTNVFHREMKKIENDTFILGNCNENLNILSRDLRSWKFFAVGCLDSNLNDPKFSDRKVWANSADQDQTAPKSDHGLHCLLFHLHHEEIS